MALSEHNQGLRDRSGSVNATDPIVSFMYILMRDHITPGAVEGILQNYVLIPERDSQFCNGYLGNYAKDIVQRLRARDMPNLQDVPETELWDALQAIYIKWAAALGPGIRRTLEARGFKTVATCMSTIGEPGVFAFYPKMAADGSGPEKKTPVIYRQPGEGLHGFLHRAKDDLVTYIVADEAKASKIMGLDPTVLPGKPEDSEAPYDKTMRKLRRLAEVVSNHPRSAHTYEVRQPVQGLGLFLYSKSKANGLVEENRLGPEAIEGNLNATLRHLDALRDSVNHSRCVRPIYSAGEDLPVAFETPEGVVDADGELWVPPSLPLPEDQPTGISTAHAALPRLRFLADAVNHHRKSLIVSYSIRLSTRGKVAVVRKAPGSRFGAADYMLPERAENILISMLPADTPLIGVLNPSTPTQSFRQLYATASALNALVGFSMFTVATLTPVNASYILWVSDRDLSAAKGIKGDYAKIAGVLNSYIPQRTV